MMSKAFSLEVSPQVPERIARLHELAGNLWYSWERSARELFGPMDPALWNEVGHNPRLFLRRVDQALLDKAAHDPHFLGRYHQVLSSYDTYLADRAPKMAAEELGDGALVAYFCAEYGIHESVPIYSGGLGVLAGDHCKTASDLRMPFVAIGLLYQAGYFSQEIDDGGQQVAQYLESGFDALPIRLAEDADGQPIEVRVPVADRDVRARVWRADVGHVHLYLLDTNVPANNEHDRAITYQLYGGGQEMRIQQELVLGVGGVRALRALGLKPSVWHANEGHAAFMVLERARELVGAGLGFEAALEAVSASTVFTTHTPVPAGHDHFSPTTFDHYLAQYPGLLGISPETLRDLGALGPRSDEDFNMTALALHGSRHHNGVSRLHGEVSSEICSVHWPEVPAEENPMGYITNGVHVPTFLQNRWDDLLDRSLGAAWRGHLTDTAFWERVNAIPDHLFWSVRQSIKSRALDFIRAALVAQHARNGVSEPQIERLLAHLDARDPNVLTIGFARRFATYKRAALLLHDVERLERIVGDEERPVVFVFAGKAHPADEPGQGIMRHIHEMSRRPGLRGKLLLLEGYDIGLARRLVSGVDVWLNNPVYPMEASGTSGMKAAINGTLNLSVTDGWWKEGYDGHNGWAILPSQHEHDPARRDAEDAETLYELLENEVVPLYYDRAPSGFSAGWVAKAKQSMATITPRFNMSRVLNDYTRKLYVPADRAGRRLADDGCAGATALADWKRRVASAWPGVTISLESTPAEKLNFGDDIEVSALADLNGLTAEDVVVELLIGPRGRSGTPVGGGFTALESAPHSREMAPPPGIQTLTLTPDGEVAGRSRFTLRLRPAQCGQLSFRVRVYPWHSLLTNRFDLGMMRWVA